MSRGYFFPDTVYITISFLSQAAVGNSAIGLIHVVIQNTICQQSMFLSLQVSGIISQLINKSVVYLYRVGRHKLATQFIPVVSLIWTSCCLSALHCAFFFKFGHESDLCLFALCDRLLRKRTCSATIVYLVADVACALSACKCVNSEGRTHANVQWRHRLQCCQAFLGLVVYWKQAYNFCLLQLTVGLQFLLLVSASVKVDVK